MTTRKWILLSLATLVLSVMAACDSGESTSEASVSAEESVEEKEETTEEMAKESLEEIEVEYPKVPFGWTEEKFVEVQNRFGDMPTIEDVQREIIQMTSQKVESKRVRELLGGDAPIFPFTPSYPSGLGPFDLTVDYAALTEDNLKYLREAVENLELDEEVNEYYQGFLKEWQNEDFSNLIEVHKDLLLEYANAPEEIKGYLEVDDYRLATKEEEQAFLEHFDLINQY